MSDSTPNKRSAPALEALRLYGKELFSFNDIWLFLRRYTATIALFVGVAVAAAAYIAFTVTPKFTAIAQILIDPGMVQVVRDPASGSGPPLDNAQIEGQIAVLRSESIAFAVINKLRLIDDPEFTAKTDPSAFSRLLDALTPGGAPAAKPQQSAEFAEYIARRAAATTFSSGLTIRRVGPTYAIDIAYTSVDPEKAATIANATAESYIQGQLDVNRKAAQQGSEWLENRLAQLRAQLNGAARAVELFKTGRDYRMPQTRSDVGGDGGGSSATPATGEPDAGAEPRGVTLAELESTAESYRKIYETYQQALANAVQRQSFPISNARVITTATRPLEQSVPRVGRILTLGALTGLLAGLGIAMLRHSLDRTVRSARQVRELTGLPCLALVPSLDRGARHSKIQPQKIPGFEYLNPGAGPFRGVVDAPFSPFSGAVKTLRNAIIHSSKRQPLKCVGITSAMPGEGKSTIAANLAALFSITQGRTLLIDADIHRATVSGIFAPNAQVGLLEAVSGKVPYAEAILPGKGLAPDILPVAAAEETLSYEILASHDMTLMLRALRDEYEMILVDLPPVNPIVDGAAIAALLDGVVAVAAWGATPLDVIRGVADIMYTAQANLLGVVLNKVDRSMATVRVQRGWGYGYYRQYRGASAAAAQAKASAGETAQPAE